jgi:hypothetical protein
VKSENVINTLAFFNPFLKKSNYDVCLAYKTHFPVNKSRKRISVRRLVKVIQLTGNSDNRSSTAVAAAVVLDIKLIILYSVFGSKPGA